MTKVLTLSLIVLFNVCQAACNNPVRRESLSQIKSISTIAAGRAWLVSEKGDLVRTRDGGKTWQNTPSETIGGFQSATMLNSRRGFAVNNRGQVWSSDDSGLTWAMKATLKSADWHFNESNQIQFVDDLHGWIIETLSIWRTEDGGANWQKLFSPLAQKTAGQPVRAFFVDSNHVWVCGTEGEIYSTSDGGRTWLTQTISRKDSAFTDIFFVNGKYGWVVGYASGQFNNLLYRTDDGGKTWESVQTNIDHTYVTSLYFLNENEGWACGETWSNRKNSDTARGVLMRTTDGGQSWQSVFTTGDEPFFDRIRFLDQGDGWLFARDRVYRTDDNGKSWHEVLKLPSIKTG